MSFLERDEMDPDNDRLHTEYYDALDAAEAAGEDWFSFEDFVTRCEANRRHAASVASTLPAPPDDTADITF